MCQIIPSEKTNHQRNYACSRERKHSDESRNTKIDTKNGKRSSTNQSEQSSDSTKKKKHSFELTSQIRYEHREAVMNQTQCHNCYGYRHKSARCPFPPKNRRCFDCGKSGGKYAHRPDCNSKWYDLSGPVARSENGNELNRDECMEVMSREFYAEKLARQNEAPRQNAAPSDAPNDTNTRREAKTEDRTPKIELQDVEMASKMPLPSDSDSEESETESENDSENGGDTQLAVVSSAHMKEWKTLKRLERETIDTLQRIRTQLRAIEEESTLINATAGMETGSHNRAVAHRPTEANDVLMRIEFEELNRLLLAEDGSNDADLSLREHVMRNGLRLRFANSVLEIRGAVRSNEGFQLSTIGMPFRLAITASAVDVDERFRLSRDGLLVRAADNNELPAITRHELTLCGRAQDIIRVQYRGFRYEIDCTGNQLAMRPEPGAIAVPVIEEID